MNFRDMTWRSSSRTTSALEDATGNRAAKVVDISRVTKVLGDEITLAEAIGYTGGATLDMGGAKLWRGTGRSLPPSVIDVLCCEGHAKDTFCVTHAANNQLCSFATRIIKPNS